jgi:hypothetical protein
VSGSELLEALTLVRSLCSPLAFLHGEGIVHRDLKPDNILIRADGLPVLVDFGLVALVAAEVSREALELGAGAAGTVAYMAPEQARGELVDARADLYAVGCILYELITGRPPFVGRSPSEVLRQHIELDPSAPSTWVDGLPSGLDELVLRLLAKDRRFRIGHADDVAAALARLGAKDGLAKAGPRPRAHLYRPALAGREAALRELDAALDRLGSRSGGLVLIGGESGVGKTRLVMEIARRAERRNLQVLTGGCQDTAARPLEAFHRPLEAIADRCRELGKQETDRLLGPRGRVLAQYEAALVGLPGQDDYPEPADLPAEAARRRLFGALSQCFGALAAGGPLLLVLDDLQWADELTVGFLDDWMHPRSSAARAAAPLLVVGTYRSEEVAGPRTRRFPTAHRGSRGRSHRAEPTRRRRRCVDRGRHACSIACAGGVQRGTWPGSRKATPFLWPSTCGPR